MKVLLGIVALILIQLALYQGLALSGVFSPPLMEGWLGGVLPTISATLGTICFAKAFKS